jgi:FG-GAP repeat
MIKRSIFLRVLLILGIISLLAVPFGMISTSAQGGSIQLAVDTANFEQDGLLVLFGGLRLQGDIGLPVGAGDINGDGKSDVMFCGMYGSTGARINNGVVNIYISDGRDSGYIDTSQNVPNVFRVEGERSGDLLGTSVSARGDVNGDGLADIAVAASGHDGPDGLRTNAGAAYVVYGARSSNFNADLNTLSSNPPPGILAIYGPQSGGRFGIWIDEGDVDGDGFADVVVGSDQINTDAGTHAGGAYIIFGSASLPSVIDLAAPPQGVRVARIFGSRQEEHWGAALHVADINDDGIKDVVIAGSIFRDSGSYISPNDQDNGHNARAASFGGQRPGCGEAYVIYGQRNWPFTTDLRTPPANATRVIGAQPVDLLGSQIHSGDLNGDGRTDLIVGALQATAPDNKGKTGAVYVIYGAPNLPGATVDTANPDASGLRVTTIWGEHALDCAGDSVRSFDINKDGLWDLFVGSPERTFEANGQEREDAGVTEIIFGQRDFLPPVIKLYDPPASPVIYRLAGANGEGQGLDGGDEFSYRLTGGDVDGDGYVDYIANAMHGDGLNNGIVNAGEVYIFSGKKLSGKLGRLVAVDPTPAPQLTSVTLSLNGQNVSQANAGQTGLRITIRGVDLRPDTEVTINGVVAVSHFNGTANPPTITIDLDENAAIKNSAGQLVVRARNVNPPPSGPSNEVVAGRLIGLEISSVSIKKKSAKTILKITGANFPSNGTVEVRTDSQLVPLKNVSIDTSDYIELKIKARDVPPSGTALRVRVISVNGTQSNVATVTVP